jgi:hypothetical protein
MNVVTGPLDAAEFSWHMLRDRKLAERKFPSIIIRSKANPHQELSQRQQGETSRSSHQIALRKSARVVCETK